MKLADLLDSLRRQLSDAQKVGWPEDAELTAYLDRAAEYVSNQLIAAGDPTMLKELVVGGDRGGDDVAYADGDVAFCDTDPLVPVESTQELPEDFAAFAGNVPIAVVGRTARVYAALASMRVLYWSRLPAPSRAGGGELPYTGEQALAIVDAARVFALNRNEYDASQDLALLGETARATVAARRR